MVPQYKTRKTIGFLEFLRFDNDLWQYLHPYKSTSGARTQDLLDPRSVCCVVCYIERTLINEAGSLQILCIYM
ncbi:unnamed protein product [Trifolium pratense]|uniref:Uncharacterized protein n=1 Tax=Trifolium pratense TaxID=57577 RepID=A0ACB0K8F9_TRIPR|nr:unnamed protein product [Trifolium pratense]